MSVRHGSPGHRVARRGPLRHVLIAAGAVAVLTLSACASSIAGSPVAADAVPPAGISGDGSDILGDGGDAGGLPVPSDGGGLLGSDGSTPDLSELQGLLDGLGADGQMPDMSQLQGLIDSLGGDGQLPDMSELQGLLDGLTGTGDGDATGLIDQLGGAGGLGALSSSCLQVSGALMSIGFLFMGPAMGQSLDAKTIDDAFSSLADVPAELQADIQTLHQAAQATVGKSGADAQTILSSPAVSDAMDHLTQYVDASCGGN